VTRLYAAAVPGRFAALIMAAGHGTRMRSSLPKVLHPVCGRPMVEWVIDTAREAGADQVIVVTRPGDGVAERLPEGVTAVEQEAGEGTGAAVLAAREVLDADKPVAVLSADHPLITTETVAGLLEAHRAERAAATILITEELDPAAYGRVVRSANGDVERLVETKDPTAVPEEILAIREINLGTYVFQPAELFEALDQVGEERGERYLTAVVPVLARQGRRVVTHPTPDALVSIGVNSPEELAEAERIAQSGSPRGA
jgi:bifunctional UDP-N-acetylglucosamine pyrophosphorylase / glucosamine-1-phosphate N-acetyltransferase